MDAEHLEGLERALGTGEPVFVRWRPEIADAVPSLREAVDAFDPGTLSSAIACAGWLKEHALDVPQESATRLYIAGQRVLGFYALANGHAQLSRKDRKALGLGRPTQPAVVLTQIARASGEKSGTGRALVLHAIATARRVDELSAATVLALDPYDQKTAEMWAERYHFRASELSGPGRPQDLPRMWLPLSTRLET